MYMIIYTCKVYQPRKNKNKNYKKEVFDYGKERNLISWWLF